MLGMAGHLLGPQPAVPEQITDTAHFFHRSHLIERGRECGAGAAQGFHGRMAGMFRGGSLALGRHARRLRGSTRPFRRVTSRFGGIGPPDARILSHPPGLFRGVPSLFRGPTIRLVAAACLLGFEALSLGPLASLFGLACALRADGVM